MIRRAAELYRELSLRRLALIAVAALGVSILLAFSRPIVMMVDGERVDSDVSPVTTASDKAFVPLRSIADALGAETEVDLKTGSVYVVLGNQSLRVRVGDTRATVNGMAFTLKHAPFRVRGRVMVSLDAVARALRVRAKYDPRAARIEVITPGIGQAPNPQAPAQ
ncbi:MAG TPA: copper amine oxidase N-terminal domain-containing protein [Candidatus Babeliales bacterium]|nr:copper amine oxidase N-terminal domain-containing protein [Candidatus Babeliales bacterium]